MRLAKRAYVIYKQGGVTSFIAHSWLYLKNTVFRDLIFVPLLTLVREVLSRLVSTESGLVLIGFDSKLRGNSATVYEYLIENDVDGLFPVWVTEDDGLFDELTTNGYPVVHGRSLEAQRLLLRADIACYDSLSTHTFPDSVTTIKMRHEVPVKNGVEAARDAATPTDAPDHDYILSSSTFMARKQLEYHRARKGGESVSFDQFLPSGFPRNDVLFDVPDETREHWDRYIGNAQYDTVILYAPTRRRQNHYETQNTDLFPFSDFSIGNLHSLLHEENALLLIRFHPDDARQIVDADIKYSTRHDHDSLSAFIGELCSNPYVRTASADHFTDTNELLQFADVLITDYSTVYHTFLLLDRPILFFPYDYEVVNESFGFKYDYYENLPGPAIDSFEDFERYVRILSNRGDPHQDQRRELRQKIHEQPDGNATERVIDHLKNLRN